jgi:hypothetical protein
LEELGSKFGDIVALDFEHALQGKESAAQLDKPGKVAVSLSDEPKVEERP